MNFYKVSVEHRFPVSPERVYNLIIDMEEHRRILPRQFESLDVMEGGKGAGTVFRLTIHVMGSRSSLVMTLSEPEPGRIVQEQDEKAGVTTIWKLIPEPGVVVYSGLPRNFRTNRGFPVGWNVSPRRR